MKLKFIIITIAFCTAAAICFFRCTKSEVQCQVIRTMAIDSSDINDFSYDKQNRVVAVKTTYVFEGKKEVYENSFSYNEQNKIILSSHKQNGKLFRTREFTYKNSRLDQMVDTYLADSSVFKGSFFYNDKGQMSKSYRKSNKGDTLVTTYEWANEGWLKRMELRSSYAPVESFALENVWDSNNTVKDPESMLFEGQEIEFSYRFLMPHTPLSVKGNVKSQTYFELNKNGVFEATGTTELYDFKANDSGYLIENKYKDGDKIQTFINQYQGCKN